MVSSKKEPYILPSNDLDAPTKRFRSTSGGNWVLALSVLTAVSMALGYICIYPVLTNGVHRAQFHATVNSHASLCAGADGKGASHSGYIGLKGDNEDAPKRSFYWLFEAQNDSENVPVILTIGGGPGTSGILNPLLGQSHCAIKEDGTTTSNPNAWSEHFNLLALDHPIGVGFSYGTMVNNSRDAAIDVYDFLQKFFVLFPHLSRNKFVVAGGSYGGIYVPHIATVIHEQNLALARGEGQPDAVHINLDSLMISNPWSDALSHYRWLLKQSCDNTHLYNETACTELYGVLPTCLEAIQYAYDFPSAQNRNAALGTCVPLKLADTNGTMMENVKKKCDAADRICWPEFAWVEKFLNNASTREQLGIPEGVEYQAINTEVHGKFWAEGDHIQRAYLMYAPLLDDGIRVLHYIGKLDANCGWPGILSFLRLLPSRFQEQFRDAPDVPWPSEDVATARVIGEGAGNMTFVLMAEAGHLVVLDQPKLVKNIVEHWVDNRPFN